MGPRRGIAGKPRAPAGAAAVTRRRAAAPRSARRPRRRGPSGRCRAACAGESATDRGGRTAARARPRPNDHRHDVGIGGGHESTGIGLATGPRARGPRQPGIPRQPSCAHWRLRHARGWPHPQARCIYVVNVGVSSYKEPVARLDIYLDSADWSYLQEGRASEAEAKLRCLASDSEIALFISWEHMAEMAGLKNGLFDRLKFIKGFPNSHVFQSPSDSLLSSEVRSLACAVRKQPLPHAPLNAGRISEAGDAVLEKILKFYGRPVRHVNRMMSEIAKIGRASNDARTAVELASRRRIVAQILRGEVDKVVKTDLKDGLHIRIAKQVLRGGVRALSFGARKMRDGG